MKLKVTEEMECTFDHIASLCENLLFFCIFCVSLILNTVLTAVYIDLSSFSYGKYKEAKCRIQYIGVSSNLWMLPLWEKNLKAKDFFSSPYWADIIKY